MSRLKFIMKPSNTQMTEEALAMRQPLSYLDVVDYYSADNIAERQAQEELERIKNLTATQTSDSIANNPFSIRYTTNDNWEGLRTDRPQTSTGFARFNSMYYGIRAGLSNIYNSLKKAQEDGRPHTLRSFINKYAPATDGNNTSEYLRYAMQKLGIGADEALNPNDFEMLFKLASVIGEKEHKYKLDRDTFNHFAKILNW